MSLHKSPYKGRVCKLKRAFQEWYIEKTGERHPFDTDGLCVVQHISDYPRNGLCAFVKGIGRNKGYIAVVPVEYITLL